MKLRITSILLALTTVFAGFAATACKKRPEPELSRVTHVYKSTDIELPDGFSISSMFPTDGGVMVYGVESTGEEQTRADYENRKNVVLTLDIETGDYTRLELPKLSGGSMEYMGSICPASDGSILYATELYDEKAEKSYYRLYRFADGTSTLLTEDVESLFWAKAEDAEFGFGDFYLQELVVDGEDNIYFCTDSMIGVFDAKMTKLFEIELTGWLDGIGTTADGRVWCKFYDRQNGGQAFRFIDPAKKGFGEDIKVPEGNNVRNADFYIGPGYEMYYNDDISVWGYNAGSEPVELLNWINSDIIPSGISELVVIDAGTFVANYYERRPEGSLHELYLLKQIPDEEVPERYVIDLAVNYVSYELPQLVVKFNRSSDEYRVRLTDYQMYNTEDNYQLADETLYNEFAAGDAPDIVSLANFSNRSKLLEENVFLDLYEFMDQDESFDRTQLFDCVLKPFEQNGELHELVTMMSIMTLAGKTANLPGERWTLDEFLDWAEKLPEEKHLYTNINKQALFNQLLMCAIDSFVDADAGTVDFKNDTFRRLLEYANSLDDFSYYQSLSGDALADYNEDRNRVFREDRILLENASIYETTGMIDVMFSFGFEPTTFIGYPSDGSGSFVQPSTSYAINKNSPVAEGAWEFIKSTLENYDNSRGGRMGIPALRSQFREAAEEEMKMHYFYRYDGGRSGSTSADFFDRYSESQGIYRDTTVEDIEQLEALVNGAEAVPSYADKVIELVGEEIGMYFAGDKSLDETVNIIDNRVGIYIAENS